MAQGTAPTLLHQWVCQHRGCGRVLLLWGGTGCGKTHVGTGVLPDLLGASGASTTSCCVQATQLFHPGSQYSPALRVSLGLRVWLCLCP